MPGTENHKVFTARCLQDCGSTTHAKNLRPPPKGLLFFNVQGGGGATWTRAPPPGGGGPRLLLLSLVARSASGRPGKKDSVLREVVVTFKRDSVLREVVVAESPQRRLLLGGSLCYEK